MSARAPRALRQVLALRARIAAQVRTFFAARDVLEVDTPLLYPHAPPDPHQRCLTAHDPAGARRGFLQPSPEFALKRLLAGGAPSLYQLGKAFRADEAGPRHRSEFALLEWYRVGWDYRALMDETAALAQAVLGIPSPRRLRWLDLLGDVLGEDPLEVPEAALWARLDSTGAEVTPALRAGGRAGALDLIQALIAEPERIGTDAVLVYDYPAAQTAQARRCVADPRLAERFELYVGGLEVANGYTELTDAVELRARFEADNAARAALGLPAVALDEALLAAIETLPACAGVALGFDRLVMLAAGADSIADVLPLDVDAPGGPVPASRGTPAS